MKEQFIEKRFTRDSQAIIDTANKILTDYQSQGYDLSLRQLYYQFVARNLIENTENSYKRIGSIISDARLAGLLDWDMIRDRGRETVQWLTFESTKQAIERTLRTFKLDRWQHQPVHVEVMVEKQALEGVLQPVCSRHQVPFAANKGYSSSSHLYETGQRIEQAIRDGRRVAIIYLGDHDPSGIDMTRDIEERLGMFCNLEKLIEEIEAEDFNMLDVTGTSHFSDFDFSEYNSWDLLTIKRIALNMNQIEELNPPKNPAKQTDSRFEDYAREFGEDSWELDAIEPRRLADMVSDAILEFVDEDIDREYDEREEAEKTRLRDFANTLEG